LIVPEGRPKIARRFIAGYRVRNASRPSGTLELSITDRILSISSVPLGRGSFFEDNPAMKGVLPKYALRRSTQNAAIRAR